MNRRIKTVAIDNLSFVISSITFDEWEEQAARTKQLLDNKDTKPEEWQSFSIQGICESMNNAQPDVEVKWTEERFRKELDPHVSSVLREEILSFSGLGVKPGEAPAASKI